MSDGLGMGLSNLSRLSHAKSRSISAENPDGAKNGGGKATTGAGENSARDLGQGWKVSPCIHIQPGDTVTLADIEGPGAIQQMWFTTDPRFWRTYILRMYWDGEATPSVEVPLGDFFCSGWCQRAQVSSLAVAVNPAGGFNCYWEMPFRKRGVITIENRATDSAVLFYQINYALAEVSEDAAYFHAQWRRSNPLPYKEVHTLTDGITGWGHYVGTYMAWGVNNNGWWGEGEIKFYIDGDEWPTICGTGTEDYFGGAWNFEHPKGEYNQFSNLYTGLSHVIRPDGLYSAQTRFSLYRWHLTDPVRFEKDLKVTIQALGWRSGGRYLPLQDDISSTVFWYQRDPHGAFPALPDRDTLEVI